MSDDLHSKEERLERQLDSNRRKKVEGFTLKIDADAIDEGLREMEMPEEDEYPSSRTAFPSRNDDDIELPPAPPEDFYRSEREEEKRRRRALKSERKRKKKKAKKNGCVFRLVWLVMVVLLGIVLAEFLLVGINDLLGRNRTADDEDSSTIIITIPENATLDEVTEILVENGVISSSTYFKLYANLTKSSVDFVAGTYEIDPDLDYEAIINYLESNSNRVDTVTLTITEGMTVLEIADLLDENGVCDGDEFLEECNSTDFDEDFTFLSEGRTNLSSVYYRLEGYLYPDTYEFYMGESATTSIYRFLNNYETVMYYTQQRVEVDTDSNVAYYDTDTDTDERNVITYEKLTIEEQAERQGMTMEEVLILASIIQAEAADTEDMYVISSIFHNRLDTIDNSGYTVYGEYIAGQLESDATMYYPYRSTTVPDGFTSRYNTYNLEGLPAGAICNPGMDAIQAALYPDDTTYYFFFHMTDEDGNATAYYATTLSNNEYNKVVAGYTDE